jgi:hypothetical protein
MKNIVTYAASAALFVVASSASAQTVLNTDLPNLSGNFGGGVATTTTGPTGTVSTVTGPGGAANRGTAMPAGPNSWFQANVGGGGSVGITTNFSNDGNGAAYFASTSGDSKADLQLVFAAPVALRSIQSYSFDFYIDPASQPPSGVVFAPVMRFDVRKNGAFAGSLVFEYIYQNQTAAPIGQWTTQSGGLPDGIWWATNAALGPTFAAANGGQKTLKEWISDNGDGDLTVTGVSIGIGSGWGGTFVGAVDNVRFDFGTVVANYDFAVVPEPATWALMIGGFGLVGGTLRVRRRNVVFA